jgi:hypothetical protein
MHHSRIGTVLIGAGLIDCRTADLPDIARFRGQPLGRPVGTPAGSCAKVYDSHGS